jgi:hypothetical protein
MPAISRIPSDPIGLHLLWYRPGPAKAHPARLGHQDGTHVAAQPPNAPRLDRHDTESLIPISLAPRWAAVRPAEVALPGLCEVTQGLLLHHLAAGAQPTMLGACLSKLTALFQIPRRAVAAGTPPRVLLYRQIPNKPCVRTMITQHRFLNRRRIEPVPGHNTNVLATTDISGEVKRRLLLYPTPEVSALQS